MNKRVLILSRNARRHFAARLARPMFALALVFLVVLAAAIHHVAGAEYRNISDETLLGELQVYFWILVALWPLFWIEILALWLVGRRHRSARFSLWSAMACCLCPPLRMGASSALTNGQLWLPFLGWQNVDRHLRNRLERLFSVPMVVIALMILPVLAVEQFGSRWITEHQWLRLVLTISAAVIWLAFAIEFVIMVSVADRKFTYCRRNWIDLLIIVLPLVYVLRCLRVLRLARLMRLGQLTRLTQTMSRMSRLYRLRGSAVRAYRALLILEVAHRVIRPSPEKKLQHLRAQLAAKQEELDDLQQAIAQLERQIALKQPTAATAALNPQPPTAESSTPPD